MRLEGKRILITGAGSGIGRALAIEASRRGAVMCLCGRREDALVETMSLLAPGAIYQIVPADITCDADVDALVSRLRQSWGTLDILVNNAGQIAAGRLDKAPSRTVVDLFSTNVIAPILLTQRCLPLLRQASKPRIVNIGSMLGEIPLPDFAAYSASKAAIKGFSMALRRELAHEGVAVTYAAPRATDTQGAASVADKITGSKLDDPARVATRLWNGVEAGRDSLYPGPMERLFMMIQAFAPKLIDRATAASPASVRTFAHPAQSSGTISNAQD
ncbi:SDR family NAD(P)-dependent oxidoreductase [Allorhizobium sp. BGMRC 0089]|uniref:SDR family NAD(P)-dependent oxidoreductase n=1 Tax=Allorhizobium sonneratiae TaxID=2934936 RepID=UPI002033F906|nr:SDR family NAD(P)-dependent oxidoreductase [Allorhizobium sonneratiae]MCM2293791.1 SDR family NAD(P)-dependent oxidoreductase [Allorhizobium sonneratiae]